MLKVIRQGRSRLEDGSPVRVEHCLDETPPKAFFLNTNTPIAPEQRYTATDARRVFDALIPNRFKTEAPSDGGQAAAGI